MANTKTNDKRCSNCNKIKSNGQFFKGIDICKSCLKVLIIEPQSGKISLKKIDSTMKILNKPFIEDLCIRVLNREGTTPTNFIGLYLKELNLNNDYKNATYLDSILFNERNRITKQVQTTIEKEEKDKEEVTDDMRFFWTKGLADITDKEILILQKMYDEYTNNGDSTIVTSKKTQDDFKALCKYELQKSKIEYNLEEVKTVQVLQKMIDDLSESLGIQAIQKQTKFDSGKFTLGLIARYRELTKPIPRWEQDEKNYNVMKDLIKTHYLGGMGISMGKSSPEIEKAKERLKEFEVQMNYSDDNNEEDDDE